MASFFGACKKYDETPDFYPKSSQNKEKTKKIFSL
jgi:hypothetical protein